MASVIFTPAGENSRGTPAYRAKFDRMGKGLARKPPLSAKDMLIPRPGQRSNYPRGVDLNAPRLS